jgi:hypothetical protein
VVAVTTIAGGALQITIADSKVSACSQTGQSVTIVLSPDAGAGTFAVINMTDGGVLPPRGRRHRLLHRGVS